MKITVGLMNNGREADFCGYTPSDKVVTTWTNEAAWFPFFPFCFTCYQSVQVTGWYVEWDHLRFSGDFEKPRILGPGDSITFTVNEDKLRRTREQLGLKFNHE